MIQTRLRRIADLTTEATENEPRPRVALEHIESGTGKVLPDADIKDIVLPGAGVADVAVGDVLFGKLRPYLAKTWVADRPVLASTELLCLRPRVGIDSRWFGYLMLSSSLVEWAVATSDGAKMPRTNWKSLGEFRVMVPPLDAQQAIADYLDRETARIDALVAAKRRMVELLEERFDAAVFHSVAGRESGGQPRKASGLAWVDTIPLDWGTPPVAANFEVHLGKMLDAQASAGPDQRPYLRNVNVQWDRIDIDDVATMHFDEKDRKRFALHPGDLLVCEGGEVGRAAIWHGNLGEFYFQKALHRIRPARDANTRFLLYCLRAAAKHAVFDIEGNLSTIAHLTREQLRRYRFPWPSDAEQVGIVERLDILAVTIRSAVDVLNREVGLLHERRQALITAVATGQLDVTETP